MAERNFARRGPHVRLAHPFLLTIFLLAAAAPLATAQPTNTCDEEIGAAETSYVEGRFDNAIRLLLLCLDREDIETAQAIEGYRLLALALIRKDELPDARAAIVQLLDVYPDYEPDPVTDPPSYTALVDIVKQQVAPTTAQVEEPSATPSWFRQNMKWILPGSAVVVGGFLAAVLAGGGGGGGSNTLPPPPGPPN